MTEDNTKFNIDEVVLAYYGDGWHMGTIYSVPGPGDISYGWNYYGVKFIGSVVNKRGTPIGSCGINHNLIKKMDQAVVGLIYG